MAAPLPFAQQEPDLSAEQHFTCAELSARWHWSEQKLHDIFEKEPGVMKLGERVSTGKKRRYQSLRIPASVAARVHARLCR